VVSSTHRPHFTPGKDPISILKEVGWAPGPVWTAGKSRPHRDSIPESVTETSRIYTFPHLSRIYVIALFVPRLKILVVRHISLSVHYFYLFTYIPVNYNRLSFGFIHRVYFFF